MRQIGTVANEADAIRLTDYLLTLGITTRLDEEAGGWAVWVRDEDHVARAQHELTRFLQNPSDARYQQARTAARQVRKQAEQAEKRHAKNFIDARTLWDSPRPGSCPLTIVLILVSVLASLTSQFGRERGQVLYRLAITGFTTVQTDFGGERIVWEPNLDRIRQGEVWRLLTPIFLHFSILHLAFNMFWLYDLGGRIESYRGAWKLALLVLLAGIPANLGQYAASGPYFGGMSGVVYALFGYVWMKSRFDPGPGMYVHFHIVVMMIVWLFLGLTGLLGPIGNTAHFVGLAVGVVLGYAPVAWRRLRRR